MSLIGRVLQAEGLVEVSRAEACARGASMRAKQRTRQTGSRREIR